MKIEITVDEKPMVTAQIDQTLVNLVSLLLDRLTLPGPVAVTASSPAAAESAPKDKTAAKPARSANKPKDTGASKRSSGKKADKDPAKPARGRRAKNKGEETEKPAPARGRRAQKDEPEEKPARSRRGNKPDPRKVAPEKSARDAQYDTEPDPEPASEPEDSEGKEEGNPPIAQIIYDAVADFFEIKDELKRFELAADWFFGTADDQSDRWSADDLWDAWHLIRNDSRSGAFTTYLLETADKIKFPADRLDAWEKDHLQDPQVFIDLIEFHFAE